MAYQHEPSPKYHIHYSPHPPISKVPLTKEVVLVCGGPGG
jgi:hypothetical protein